MGLFRKPVQQNFPELPDNLYFARLAKITAKTGKSSGKPYMSWGFEIIQPPHQKRWVWANTQPTVSPKSQTGKFLTELGVDIAKIDPDTFNEQELIGRYVKVLVETTESAEGDKFQNVTKLMHIAESEQSLLQSWLAQANVKGPIQVASAPVQIQQPVLAAAPVSFPPAPASTAFPGFTQPAPTPVTAPVVTSTPVAKPVAPATKPLSKFPF